MSRLHALYYQANSDNSLGNFLSWDEVYNVEVENFETDGDEGEVW